MMEPMKIVYEDMWIRISHTNADYYRFEYKGHASGAPAVQVWDGPGQRELVHVKRKRSNDGWEVKTAPVVVERHNVRDRRNIDL